MFLSIYLSTYQSDPIADGVPQAVAVGHGGLVHAIFQKRTLEVFDVWSADVHDGRGQSSLGERQINEEIRPVARGWC